MTMINQDFEIYQGEDRYIEVIVYEDDDNTKKKNIQGATISWICKKKVDSTIAILSKTVDSGITITDATNGVFMISLSATETKDLYQRYYHEAKIVLNNKNNILLTGNMIVKESGF